MANNKTLLISLLRNSHRNLSCLSLFSSLKANDIETKLLFLPKPEEYHAQELQNFVKANGFIVIGISVMTDDFDFAKVLTADIKRFHAKSHVVWGGIHPTLMPEECLDYADSVCAGEGEKALVSLVKRISAHGVFSDIPGMAQRAGGKQVILTPPILEMDLDSLPFNRYDWSNFYVQDACGLRPFDQAEYIRYSHYGGEDYTLMASRSCPFSCAYCCNSFLNKLYNNKRVRKRSVDNVIQEITHAIDTIHGLKFINFIDDQFFTSKEWNDEFVKKYKREVSLPFIVRLAPGSFNEDDIKKLKDAGLMFVQIGIQSGSERTHRMIFERRFSRSDIIEASRIFRKNNIHPIYDVIIQNDLEDNSDRDQTIQLLLDLKKPFSSHFFVLTPYPRTKLEEIYRERGVIPRTNPYEKGYVDFDEKDFYLQLASIIPFTPRFIVRQFFIQPGKYARPLLSRYYRVTQRMRRKTITAQRNQHKQNKDH